MNESSGMIVIDNGSSTIKAGWSGDDAPRFEFPTTLGTPRSPDPTLRDYYVGYAAQAKREILNMRYPIIKRRVTDWDDMEKIWTYIFREELKICPGNHSFVQTESALTPKADREKMTQIMFETFGCESLFVASPALLAFEGTGRTTGVVVDSGLEVTHVVTIYKEFSFPQAIQESKFGGVDITRYQENVLREKGYTFNPQVEEKITQDIKKNFSYVALDFAEEMQKASKLRKNYTLPDGNSMVLGKERFSAPEAFFRPFLAGVEDEGIHEKVYKAIMAVDICCRKDMYANIILTGGNTMFDGLGARLQKEVTALAPQTMQVKVETSAGGKFGPWLGGADLAEAYCFEGMMVTKNDYDESGPTIIHQSCFSW